MVFKAKILESIKLNKRGERQVTTQFFKTGKERMTQRDFDKLVGALRKSGTEKHENFQIVLMRVKNGIQWLGWTNWDDYEAYLEGRVKNTDKFVDFSQVQITCTYS